MALRRAVNNRRLSGLARCAAVLVPLAALGMAGSTGAASAGSDAPVGGDRPAVRLLAYGDSLIAGFGLAAADAFPARLEAALRADGLDVTVLNGGVSGDTTAGGLARLGWALADRPDLVFLCLGANDGLRGIDPATTRANLDALLNALAERGLPAFWSGMRAPRNLGPAYTRAFDALFPALAADHGVAFDPFFLEGVATVAALNQPDGLHPNSAGVARIVARLAPRIAAFVRAHLAGRSGDPRPDDAADAGSDG